MAKRQSQDVMTSTNVSLSSRFEKTGLMPSARSGTATEESLAADTDASKFTVDGRGAVGRLRGWPFTAGGAEEGDKGPLVRRREGKALTEETRDTEGEIKAHDSANTQVHGERQL